MHRLPQELINRKTERLKMILLNLTLELQNHKQVHEHPEAKAENNKQQCVTPKTQCTFSLMYEYVETYLERIYFSPYERLTVENKYHQRIHG